MSRLPSWTVWIPASKFFTPWITPKFQPLEVASICIKIIYSFTATTINVLIIITEILKKKKIGSVVSSAN
jgi:hypothetical protein